MKELWSLLSVALSFYLVLALLLFVFQRSLLYFPDKQPPSQQLLDAENLRFWPDKSNFRGVTSVNEAENVKGTVIVFHGNAGAAHHRSYYIDALSAQNYRVILAEYPGYSGRGGSASEQVLVGDAIETIAIAYKKYGSPLYLWGESLGAGVVASAIAKTDIPIKGLVLFTPWDSLPAVAQTHYWYFPVRWLIKDKYFSVENLKNYKGNIAVVLAERDEVIPIKHGQKLYDSITANKQLWLFENAQHNTIDIRPELIWWREVGEFISQ